MVERERGKRERERDGERERCCYYYCHDSRIANVFAGTHELAQLRSPFFVKIKVEKKERKKDGNIKGRKIDENTKGKKETKKKEIKKLTNTNSKKIEIIYDFVMFEFQTNQQKNNEL